MTDGPSTRRQALSSLGAIGVATIAGCITAGGDPETQPSDSPTSSSPSISVEDDTPTPTSIPDRRVTDMTVTGLSETPVSITPAVTEADITTESTAQFRLTVKATGDDRVSVQFGNQIPFSAPQRSTPPGILLLASGPEYARRNQRTWLPDTEEGDDIHPPSVVRGDDLAPGEAVAGPWEVWANPDHTSHIAPGTWEFESTLIFPRESANENVDWVLSVTIEE